MQTPHIRTTRTLTEKPDSKMFHMHTHGDYEIYCFLSGSAKYFVEGTVYPLRPRDILLIKKGEAHTLLIDDDRPYERIVINFDADAILTDKRKEIVTFLDGRGLGEKNCFHASVFKDSHWIYYLKELCKSRDVQRKQIYLTVLLCELMEQHSGCVSRDVYHDTISELILYINEHLFENLTLETLCEKFYISKPHLNRRFKQVTGTTVWDYVKRKRLLKAREMLQTGTRPTAVFSLCGFNDYSSFYVAYRKEFACAPKEDYVH